MKGRHRKSSFSVRLYVTNRKEVFWGLETKCDKRLETRFLSAPSFLTYPEQFCCPRAVALAASENHRRLRHHCFLKDTYSGGSASWRATQDGRVQLGSQAGVSKADEGEDWFVGTYWESFGGLSEFAGAQLGWLFTSQVLWAFPSFSCYNHCLKYSENFFRNVFLLRHAEVTSHESMGETQGSSSHAMPPPIGPCPRVSWLTLWLQRQWDPCSAHARASCKCTPWPVWNGARE